MSISISISVAVFSGDIGFLIANDACEDVVGTTGVGPGSPPGPTWLTITEPVSPCESAGCCELLAIDECGLDDSCRLLEGRRLNDDDDANICLEPLPAGCMAREMVCTEATTRALDPEGACWWFATGCQPPSFAELEPSDPMCSSVEDAPLCR